jgi:truncated hemoglobin YjbI
MLCMRTALDEQVGDEALHQGVLNAFVQMADHMVNVAPPPRP